MTDVTSKEQPAEAGCSSLVNRSMPDNRLYVGNLPSSATDAELKAKFGQFGSVVSAVIARDAATGRSRRFAHVEMATRAEALAAISRLNMTLYDDVIMSVTNIRPAGRP